MRRWWCGLFAAAAVAIAAVAVADDILPPGMDEPPASSTRTAGESGKGPARESNPIAEIETLRPHYDDVQARHAERIGKVSDARVTKAIQTGADALIKRLTQTMEKDAKASLEKQLVGQDVLVVPAREGVIPMSLYALLVVGRAIEDERFLASSKELSGPIKYTINLKSDLTYSNAVQAIALGMMPARAEVVAAMTGAKTRLMNNMWKDGAFGYSRPNVDFYGMGENFRDGSNSQFALLGMWACDEAGVAVPESFWKISDQLWRSRQAANGGWGYEFLAGGTSRAFLATAPTRQTMTAAGVASLYVTASRLNKSVGLEPKPDAAMAAGVACLERNFELMRTYMGTNPYFAYSMERVARASGKKYFGPFDWFREGAAEIIADQEKGFWGDVEDAPPYAGTCFALLFLARGNAPVVFNKLQYPGAWDARPQDVANLTRWLEKKSERVLNWEIVDIDGKAAGDWADAPVLVIAGHGDPHFTQAQMERLRAYVNSGGIIFSTADGGDAVFSEAIKTKYAPMICEQRYEMRVLPKSHALYTLDIKAGAARETPLWGMNNGARELWIHSPKDMGAAWQSQAETQKEQWDLPANLITYASGRIALRRRLETLAVADPETPPGKAASVARVKYAGNWEPEPAAWTRFARTAALKFDTKLTVTTAGFAELNAAKTPTAHLTGTDAITLGDADRAGLKKYLSAGGFLIADAAGGADAFARSLQAELAKIGATVNAVDLEKHAVPTGNFPGGAELKNLEQRRFCLTPENVKKKMQILEVTLEGKRVGILFEGDVTSGLLGTNTWGILGYSSTTSEALMWNAVMLRGK